MTASIRLLINSLLKSKTPEVRSATIDIIESLYEELDNPNVTPELVIFTASIVQSQRNSHDNYTTR